jgi:hypothetical protein
MVLRRPGLPRRADHGRLDDGAETEESIGVLEIFFSYLCSSAGRFPGPIGGKKIKKAILPYRMEIVSAISDMGYSVVFSFKNRKFRLKKDGKQGLEKAPGRMQNKKKNRPDFIMIQIGSVPADG